MRNYATFLDREWVAGRCSYYSSGLGLRLKCSRILRRNLEHDGEEEDDEHQR